MQTATEFPLLARIETPADLRQLPVEQLPQVCHELRQFIIDHVSRSGGHLGASLGTVELTVALHYVLQTPDDVLIWDVGHQAYGHKILTGRRKAFAANRKWGGIAGFPVRTESVFDAFGTGHSSTSVSAALGMANASRLAGNYTRTHAAVIGDGGLTAGMAFEALNHAASSSQRQVNLLVIVNDNGISIDPNIGALHEQMQQWPNQSPTAPTNFFQSLNIPYYGIADGHDVIALVHQLTALKAQQGLRLLHCRTIKGKGLEQAEQNQTFWHSPGKFDKHTGEIISIKPSFQPAKYQDVFGETLAELAARNPQIVGITPAMLSGSSMQRLMDVFPERTFDVGIAEQHAVTFAAGMAAQGMIPYCNLYATFAQRAYDQMIHDVCLQKLKVIFCLDRAGLVGADGATHQGAFDIASLRCIPELLIAAPMDEAELRQLLYTAQLSDIQQPFAIRYPRGHGVLQEWRQPFQKIPVGKGRILMRGERIAVLSIGHTGNFVQQAAIALAEEGIRISHYDMRFVKPLDEELLAMAAAHRAILTVEDGILAGGFGSAVLEWLADRQLNVPVIRLGLPDEFIPHGEPAQQYDYCGIDTAHITARLRELWQKTDATRQP
ncbi:1-deoxy-D-xylulose-5-phosphate synthase [Rhodoflexus caldus]|uniref:1-deoxy-D-xylulose-5-phosphate synthase n=1 Tax=Rhodoflexus caldus TaxID=2891236 RepID=UPI00202A96C5|nr:1-deoxy-D-xylulose-5-phosphate synthase [Rhodoflexus caldus]